VRGVAELGANAGPALAEEAVFNDYVRHWKQGGGRVIGYSCLIAPLELLEAAGLLPYRIKALGSAVTELADAEMSLYNCSFCRSCLQLGLDGTYSFLDGVIETNGCDHMRAMFENWQHRVEPPFFHYLKAPHDSRKNALDYFRGGLELLKRDLEEHFGVEITEESLERAMRERAEVRELWRELSGLREQERPAVSGAEALALEVRGSSMTAKDFAGLLRRFIEERRGAPGREPQARLMFCGPATDEVEWFAELEEMGAAVVADTLCFGTRNFMPEPPSEGEVMDRLARGYLGNLFCPRMYLEYGRRRDFMLQTARRARVDGAVYLYNKFCDLHGVDSALLRRDLEGAGVPVLVLEKEYSARADLGRVKTRVQAFMERIGGESGWKRASS
jgi:benzoyl-CoA reductase subunit C